MHRFLTLLVSSLAIFTTGCIQSVDAPAIAEEPQAEVEQKSFDPADLTTLPDLRGHKFKVDAYLAAAVRLQEMGRLDACWELWRTSRKMQTQTQSLTRISDYQKIAVLCRMLFVPRNGEKFRRPSLGGGLFAGGTDSSDWPHEPIELVDGIPFAISQGYAIFGSIISDSYLEYCMTECDWNPVPYRQATTDEKQAALAKLLASGKWTCPLDEWERKFFAAQIEPDN